MLGEKEFLFEHFPIHIENKYCAFNSKGKMFETKGFQTLSSPFGSASILAISYLYIICFWYISNNWTSTTSWN